MAASLSQRDFATRVGVSRQYIGRLCAQGKLPTLPDKKVAMPDGLRAFHALRAEGPPPAAGSPVEVPAPQAPAPTPDAAAYAGDIRLATELRRAQLVERAHRARLLELEYEERRGLLVTLAEVHVDARQTCETIRDGLLALGPRVALLLEAVCARQGALDARAIQAIVDDEANVLLTALYAGRFAAPVQPPLGAAGGGH